MKTLGIRTGDKLREGEGFEKGGGEALNSKFQAHEACSRTFAWTKGSPILTQRRLLDEEHED